MGRFFFFFFRQVQLGGDPEADPALAETPQCSAGPLPSYLLQPPEEVAGGGGGVGDALGFDPDVKKRRKHLQAGIHSTRVEAEIPLGCFSLYETLNFIELTH